jgi:hypothetical protein
VAHDRAFYLEYLLDDLCAEFGYCIPPAEKARLIEHPPDTVDDFVDAVFVATNAAIGPAAASIRAQTI